MTATKKKKSSPAKKSGAKNNKKKKKNKGGGLSPFGVGAVLCVIGAALLLIFLLAPTASDGAGMLLKGADGFFVHLFGKTRFLFALYLLALSFAFFFKEKKDFRFVRYIVFLTILFVVFPVLFCIGLPFVDFKSFMARAWGESGGGAFGGFLAFGMLRLFNEIISVVILIFAGLLSVIMLTGFSVSAFLKNRAENMKEARAERKAAAELAAEYEEDEQEEELPSFDFDDPGYEVRTGQGRRRRPPVPGKKKLRTVHYQDEDNIIVDGALFSRGAGRSIAAEEPGEENSGSRYAFEGDGNEPDAYSFGGTEERVPGLDIFDETDWDKELPDMEPGSFIGQQVMLESSDSSQGMAAEDFLDDVPADKDEDTSSAAPVEAAPAKKPEEKKKDSPGKTDMSHFRLPKTSILQKGEKFNARKSSQEIRNNTKILENTLQSFGVEAHVTEVSCGPSLVRYEVQPGPGVKVSKIVSLTDDIALQLAATGIRMEAPVPGKSVIGIEVPRKEKASVYFRDILENSRFFDMPSKLTCAYGQDIAGNPIIGDLSTMPHLLIAGTTGSGKSVCMNTMICSILFKARPDQVKFIMIDPKQVEFVIYEGLPHLITPVVTDPKKAAGALKWALREMENRYTLFNQNRVRNLEGYNSIVADNDRLPQIVVFIDELADLMMVAAKEVEASICRLAQKARAAGIHLVIATQRPSVDVITGLIKANIPSRIALSVSSQTDSRTILDMGGAEKLLGKGDMLYMPIGYSKPLRVQGAWLSDEDALAILDFYKKQGEPDYIEGVAQAVEPSGGGKEEYSDTLFFDAAKAAITAGQASTSMMQRRFRIGYNHAARIIEELEEKGVIGPADGAKPRKVLMSLEVFTSTFKEPEEQSLFDE